MDGKFIRQRNSQTGEVFEMGITKSLFFLRFLTIALLAGVTGVAHAQRGGFSPEQMKERQLVQAEETAKALKLSDEQLPEYMEIVTASVEKRMELITSMRGGGGFLGMREKMQEIEGETTKALLEVLTEEQMEQYKEILASRPRRGRRQG